MTDKKYQEKLVTYRIKPLTKNVSTELIADIFNLMEIHVHPFDSDGERNVMSQEFIEKHGEKYLEKLSYDPKLSKVSSEVKLGE